MLTRDHFGAPAKTRWPFWALLISCLLGPFFFPVDVRKIHSVFTHALERRATQTKPHETEVVEPPEAVLPVLSYLEYLLPKGLQFEAAYVPMAYPMGDVPAGSGSAVDVVIRALRQIGLDLQVLIHEDMLHAPEAYPTELYEHKELDTNIDHRRLPNLLTFMERHFVEIPTSGRRWEEQLWLPGDIVFYSKDAAPWPWHLGIVSMERDGRSVPLIYDHLPQCGFSRSHPLDQWILTHHFRLPSAHESWVSLQGHR